MSSSVDFLESYSYSFLLGLWNFLFKVFIILKLTYSTLYIFIVTNDLGIDVLWIFMFGSIKVIKVFYYLLKCFGKGAYTFCSRNSTNFWILFLEILTTNLSNFRIRSTLFWFLVNWFCLDSRLYHLQLNSITLKSLFSQFFPWLQIFFFTYFFPTNVSPYLKI